MNCYYDFHIHSALSPCADNDMTPNNIARMAALKGLDVIAVADHNSIANVAAVMYAGEKAGIQVMPGMEVQTVEEVHILCLFPNLSAAEKIGYAVYQGLPDIQNCADIFGEQLIFNENDDIIGKETKLLLNSTKLSVYHLYEEVKAVGGAFIPAHIDRSSYSFLSNLGFIPDDLHIMTVELSNSAIEQYNKFQILYNSDAHYLENIAERSHKIEVSDNSSNNLFNKICNLL